MTESPRRTKSLRTLITLACASLALSVSIAAQIPAEKAPQFGSSLKRPKAEISEPTNRKNNPAGLPQPDDVIRINTDLVQTDVMVFDKKGHFVDGLGREQFDLSIDGKTQPISSFELVRSGSSKEIRLAGNDKVVAPQPEKPAISESRGRTIVFFIDDLHLSLDSLGRTRRSLAQFIDHEMSDNDRVAIASTSGDIGFLQQFTEARFGRLELPWGLRLVACSPLGRACGSLLFSVHFTLPDQSD